MKFNSIKFKIGILYTAILGAILVIYSGILYLSLHHTLYHDLDEELRVKAQEIGNMIGSHLDVLGHDQRSFIFAVKRTINFEGTYPDESGLEELEYQQLQKIDKLDLTNDYINFLSSKGEFLISSSNVEPELSSLFSRGIKRIQGKEVLGCSILR